MHVVLFLLKNNYDCCENCKCVLLKLSFAVNSTYSKKGAVMDWKKDISAFACFDCTCYFISDSVLLS